MGTTKIDWATHSVNPVKGRCPNPDCILGERCYARQMYKRFKWNPVVRFVEDAMDFCLDLKPGSRVFVGSTIELFGPWVKVGWMRSIMNVVRLRPAVTFVFLTKRPLDLLRFSPFPDNSWIGTTVCKQPMLKEAIVGLSGIKAEVKFISFEPVMEEIHFPIAYGLEEIDWVIAGAWSRYSPKTAPKAEWVETIVREADRVGAKVFIKQNLDRVINGEEWGRDCYRSLRQEFPGGQG